MECACVAVNDGDYSKSISDIWRKARKSHHCGECRRQIHAGESYRIEVILCNGHVSSHKTCNDCESLKKTFFCDYVFGDIWDDFQESFPDCYEDVPWSKLALLTPAARNRVFQMIEGYWDETEDDDD